jgi:hypothetical protein
MMSLDQEQSDKDLKEVFNMVDDDGSVRNEGLLRLLFLLKTIILPRQARDKHRESSKQRRVFLRGCSIGRRYEVHFGRGG